MLLKFSYNLIKVIAGIIFIISILGTTKGTKETKIQSFCIEIKSVRKTVFNNSSAVLKEYYFLITDSKEKEMHITARRELDAFVLKELWYRIVGTIDHGIVLDIEIKEINKMIILTLIPSFQYKKHGRLIRITNFKNKPIFREIQEILTNIKEKSEVK
ncbi:MAG: hypothetical protein FJZ16_00295 [Candidatus Omnitrophica bacterium]|nr:hypothetical protein [Candidatus Omnitrophota bacterium]